MLPMTKRIDASCQSPRPMAAIAAQDVAPISMKPRSSFFLMPRVVRDGAENRRRDGDERDRERRDGGESCGRLRRLEPRRGVGGIERGKDGGDDGGEVGGVGPVVPRPRALFGGDEADFARSSRADHGGRIPQVRATHASPRRRGCTVLVSGTLSARHRRRVRSRAVCRMRPTPLKVLKRKSVLPPPFSAPRKLRRLVDDSVTGRSLLNDAAEAYRT